MSWLALAMDLILHLDKHLGAVIQQYGAWTYALLFLIIFAETGLVIAPFLPGDSLLFAAGAFAAIGSFRIAFLWGLLAAAAILGDTLNYTLGHHLGPRVFRERVRFLNRDHLDYARQFYEKHGAKTIVLARFIPIIRTFAPFVAGIGQMRYRTFLAYNLIGGLLWVSLFTFGGYFFGNLQVVKDHFGTVIIAIILLSLTPLIIEFWRHHIAHKKHVGE